MRLFSRLPAVLCLLAAGLLLPGCCCVIPIPGPRPRLQNRPPGEQPPLKPRPSRPGNLPAERI